MKRLFMLITSIIICLSAFAQTDTLAPHSPKVGLVLGGGGAKGAAHIGVLKYIEELGIPIDYVVGTSMGSIIGGLYSIGYSPNDLQYLISRMDWSVYMANSVNRKFLSSAEKERNNSYILSIPIGKNELVSGPEHAMSSLKGNRISNIMLPSSFAGGSNLLNLFNSLSLGYQDDMNFDDMPIPFACIATNVKTGEEVVLRHGKFPLALRASMSIPGVFDPIVIDGNLLMDGGFVNNFPTDRCRDMGADIIIGIEVAYGLEQDENKLKSLPQILTQLKNIAIKGHNEENRQLCDLYIKPDVNDFSMLSFTPKAIDSIVNIGYETAQHYTEALLNIKKMVGPREKTLKAPKARYLDADSSIIINKINLQNVDDKEKKWLIRKGHLYTGKPIRIGKIVKAIEIYRGTANFSKIEYTLHPVSFKDDTTAYSSYDLNINFEFEEPHTADVGMRYDTEESATLLFNLGLNQNKLSGMKANLSIGLGHNPFIHARATWAGISLANFNFLYELNLLRYNVMKTESRGSKPIFYNNALQNRFRFFVSEFHLREIRTSVGFELDRIMFFQASIDEFISQIDSIDNNSSETTWGPYAKFKFDNLNDRYFATRGIETAFDAHWRMNNPNRITHSNIFDITFYFKGYIPIGRLTLIPQFYSRGIIGDNHMFPYNNIIGGSKFGRNFDYQLPMIGFTCPYQYNYFNMVGIGRLDFRYNVADRHYLSILTNISRASYDISSFFNPTTETSENLFGAAFQYSYDSRIGPISVDVHWQNLTKKVGLYLSIGYDF